MTDNDTPGARGGAAETLIVCSDAALRTLLCSAAEAASFSVKIKMDARTLQHHPEWAEDACYCVAAFADLSTLLRSHQMQQVLRGFRLVPVLSAPDFPLLNLMLKRADMLANLSGCLLPDRGLDAMTAALKLARAHYVTLPAEMFDAALEEGVLERRLSALSHDEQAVLMLLQAGKSNREISFALGLPPHKVKSLVKSLLDRLGCRKRTAAAVIAFRFGLGQVQAIHNGPFGKE